MLSILILSWLIQLSIQTNSPIIQEILVTKNLVENSTARLLCSLSQGENVEFEWYFNDRKLIENDKIKITMSNDASFLVVKSLSIDNIGRYICKVSNEFGTDRKDVDVIFNGLYSSFFANYFIQLI